MVDKLFVNAKRHVQVYQRLTVDLVFGLTKAPFTY